jgi:signal transduction histidine kinase
MTSDTAALRVFRILAISIGLGSAIFTVLGLPAMAAQFSTLQPGYAWASILVYAGLPVAAALIAPRVSIRTLRIFAATHAASALVFLLLWVPAMGGATLPIESTPWLININAVAMTTAALALPTMAAWTYMVSVAAACGVVRFLSYGGGEWQLAFEDAVMVALFSSVMITLVQLSLQAARKQDAAASIAEDAAVRSAMAASARRSRTVYESFAHDDVLGTLLAASRNVEGGAGESVKSALRALRKLDAFHDLHTPELALTAPQLEALLRASVLTTEQPFEVRYEGSPVEAASTPANVSNALAEALREALRNSELHATRTDGKSVTRHCRATIGPTSVTIEVTDDGNGFDLRKIGVDRLGVRVSILRRINSIPGAAATVRSSRRHGTSVILAWDSTEVSRVH